MIPRNFTQAKKEGYVISNILEGRFGKNRIDMKPRFYRSGMKSIISFWLTYSGCKRLGITL